MRQTSPNLVQIMREYGEAIRGDWSLFDGRPMKSVLHEWAMMIEDETDYSDVVKARHGFSLCPDGEGHWDHYCEDYKCPTWVKEDE